MARRDRLGQGGRGCGRVCQTVAGRDNLRQGETGCGRGGQVAAGEDRLQQGRTGCGSGYKLWPPRPPDNATQHLLRDRLEAATSLAVSLITKTPPPDPSVPLPQWSN